MLTARGQSVVSGRNPKKYVVEVIRNSNHFLDSHIFRHREPWHSALHLRQDSCNMHGAMVKHSRNTVIISCINRRFCLLLSRKFTRLRFQPVVSLFCHFHTCFHKMTTWDSIAVHYKADCRRSVGCQNSIVSPNRT